MSWTDNCAKCDKHRPDCNCDEFYTVYPKENVRTISFDAGDNPKVKESVADKKLGIPTAKNFLLKDTDDMDPGVDLSYIWTAEAVTAMIEFTKLHVKAALEAASEKASLSDEYTSLNGEPVWARDHDIDKNSILNAYPESNIK